MSEHILVVTTEQLDFMRTALHEVEMDFKRRQEAFQDYTPDDIRRFQDVMDQTVRALTLNRKVKQLARPTHNGVWCYRTKGSESGSLVYVDNVTNGDPGYVLTDLNNNLEGESVESLEGTWQEVWIP